MRAKIVLKGGSGSGHYNHSGRPGKIGGSVAGGGGSGGSGKYISSAMLDELGVELINKNQHSGYGMADHGVGILWKGTVQVGDEVDVYHAGDKHQGRIQKVSDVNYTAVLMDEDGEETTTVVTQQYNPDPIPSYLKMPRSK